MNFSEDGKGSWLKNRKNWKVGLQIGWLDWLIWQHDTKCCKVILFGCRKRETAPCKGKRSHSEREQSCKVLSVALFLVWVIGGTFFLIWFLCYVLFRDESNQQFLGFQGGVPLLSKRPLVNGNLAMDKENNFLNVKRKYSKNPENRAKLHLPDVDWRNGYARPRLLSDLR